MFTVEAVQKHWDKPTIDWQNARKLRCLQLAQLAVAATYPGLTLV
jgi:hypothetical protein